MARGNKYICRVCGKTYNYCPSCGLLPVAYLDDGFCCEDHAKLFAILSKNGCGIASAEETISAIKDLGELGELNSSIQNHINSLYGNSNSEEELVAESSAFSSFFKKK